MFRSFADPKTLAFVGLSVVATSLGCSRVPGEPDELGTPWNAEDIEVYGRCVQTCSPDYGPRPITLEECQRVEEGLEFFPAPVWDWEDGGFGEAYAYQDGTSEFLSTNTPTCTVEHHATELNETNCQSQYSPIPAVLPSARCGSARAVHIRGGPFREWGGGLGVRLDGLASRAAAAIGAGMCPSPPPETPDPNVPAFCPDHIPRVATAPGWDYVDPQGMPRTFAMNEGGYYLMQVDLREWEGITFWARRGPDSQPGIRIVLADLNMDDDASFLETQGGLAPTCLRAKECDCRNHRKCTLWPAGTDPQGRPWGTGYYCAEPELDISPYAHMHPWNHELYRCNYSACNRDYPAYPNTPDAPFFTPEREMIDMYVGTASCNPFTFDNDITREGCFDKAKGPTPPESADRCGDPWIAPVRLSNDWTLYRIPFSDFRQEGYGKEFPAIKLEAVTMVRFTWHVGWIDYWIDDVRFYRRK